MVTLSVNPSSDRRQLKLQGTGECKGGVKNNHPHRVVVPEATARWPESDRTSIRIPLERAVLAFDAASGSPASTGRQGEGEHAYESGGDQSARRRRAVL